MCEFYDCDELECDVLCMWFVFDYVKVLELCGEID